MSPGDIPADQRLAIVGSLTAGLAHDLRNLMSVAETSAFVAARKTTDPEAVKQFDRIAKSVRSGQCLLSEVLAFARGEALVAKPHSIDRLLEDVLSAPEMVDGPKVEVQTPADGLHLSCSRVLLTAAIDNLVRNAREAAGPGGKVEIRVTREGDLARIAIIDDGHGFPTGAEPCVLRTTKADGTGLGLCSARAIANAHGGRLTIEPAEKGAHVVIELPCPASP